MKSVRAIVHLLGREPRFVLLVVPLLAAASFAQTMPIVGLAPIIDILVHPDMSQQSAATLKITGWMKGAGFSVSLLSVSVLFLLMMVAKGAVTSAARYLVAKVHFRLVRETMIEIFDAFLSAQWRFFVQNDYGTLGNTLLRETEKIGFAFESVVGVLEKLMRVAVFTAIAAYLSPQLTALAVGLLLVCMVPFYIIGKWTYRIGQTHMTAANAFQGLVMETLSGVKLVLGFGNQDKSMRSLKRTLTPYLESAIQFVMIRIITPLAFEPVGFVVALTVLYAGTKKFGIELSSLFIILYILKTGANLTLEALNERNAIENVLPSLEQIDRLTSEARALAQMGGDLKFERLSTGVSFEAVNFVYPDGTQTLKDCSLNLPKGRMSAIVGPSGAGKTTFLDLLMGFYRPTSGSVKIDGRPLQDYDVGGWRRRIGYVPQEPFLFHTTVRENLLWASENASPADIEKALDSANASEFVSELAEGLDTVVGDRGVRLSGGQRQRIALARALLRKPEILILDEATSALDSQSETLIQNAVEKISKEVTVIVVAHRLSTIQKADRVYALSKGRVAESGTFSELMAAGGEFSRSAQLQGLKNDG